MLITPTPLPEPSLLAEESLLPRPGSQVFVAQNADSGQPNPSPGPNPPPQPPPPQRPKEDEPSRPGLPVEEPLAPPPTPPQAPPGPAEPPVWAEDVYTPK